ncbi:hypothetical protein N7523_005743 [Penicillium sp. IBT 18751x]|nr:hypothetical protein N7523_005664 [Penicillium sp. IBT 18751x]KAJ6117992.1 hypothetical protein N7523_005743 [Penicillium sp. IBT 18751x]
MEGLTITLNVRGVTINPLGSDGYQQLRFLNDYELCHFASIATILSHSLEWERAYRAADDAKSKDLSPVTLSPLETLFSSIESTAARIRKEGLANFPLLPGSMDSLQFLFISEIVYAKLFNIDSKAGDPTKTEHKFVNKRETNLNTKCLAFAVIFQSLGMAYLRLLFHATPRPYTRISTLAFGRLVQWVMENRNVLRCPSLEEQADQVKLELGILEPKELIPSPEAIKLLSIMVVLSSGSSPAQIPAEFFVRLRSTSIRWMRSGDCQGTTFAEFVEGGDEERVLSSFSDEQQLTFVLGDLVHCRVVVKNNDTYFIDTKQAERLQTRKEWLSPDRLRMALLKLVLFVCPTDPVCEPHLYYIGHRLAPLLNHVLSETVQTVEMHELPSPVKEMAVEALACQMKSLAHSESLPSTLSLAERFVDESSPGYLQVLMAFWRSVVLRQRNDYEGSIQATNDCMARRPHFQEDRPDIRLHAYTGLLATSYLVSQGLLSSLADSDWPSPWEPSNPATFLEIQVVLANARLFVCHGMLESAQSCLASLLHRIEPGSVHRPYIQSELCDVQCDLKNFAAASGSIQDALRFQGSSWNMSGADRRLLVSSLDVYIAKGDYQTAEHGVQALKKFFQRSSLGSPPAAHEPGPPADGGDEALDERDTLLFIRTLVASARILQCTGRFRDAIIEWNEVISQVTKHGHLFDGRLCLAISWISLALAYIQRVNTTDFSKSHEDLPYRDGYHYYSQGMSILNSRPVSEFSLPTVSNHWVDFVRGAISSKDLKLLED